MEIHPGIRKELDTARDLIRYLVDTQVVLGKNPNSPSLRLLAQQRKMDAQCQLDKIRGFRHFFRRGSSETNEIDDLINLHEAVHVLFNVE